MGNEAREFLPCVSRNNENAGVKSSEQGKDHQIAGKKGSRRPRNRKNKQGGLDWRTLQSKAAQEEQVKDSERNGSQDRPICILCCDPMSVVSFGACNHMTACAKCCLRLRICYSNLECPMCKKEMKEIVLAPWRGEESMPSFSRYMNDAALSSRITNSQLGPGVVYVDKWHEQKGRSRLLAELLDMVSMSCPKCRKGSGLKFKNHKNLMEHMRKTHKSSYLCNVCLEEKRVFVQDQEVFSSPLALQKHKEEKHPACQFCNRQIFYDNDAMWHHLIQEHFRCQLCDQQSTCDAWYRNAPELQLHLANEHFACEHEHCRSCLVAFKNLDELQRHHLDHHSGRMRRWDQSQSRPLHFDYSFRSRNRHETSSSRVLNPRNYDRESQGGLEVIDDDVGMLPRDTRATAREHFPSLAEGLASSSATNTEAPKHARLVSHQVKCPCGRRKTHHVVPEGQAVPVLECDGICRLEGRKNQLDDAFGIDRSSHISVFNRKKVLWSGYLLKEAKEDVERIKEFENILEDFIKSGCARRQLAPAPKTHRTTLHGMAEQYGIPTVSMGNEPNRAIQLFKPTGNAPPAGIPDKLLSAACMLVSDEEIAKLINAAKGYQLRFHDISKTVDLHYFVRRYSDPDGYTITWDGDDAATVVFDQQDSWKQAKEGLQGGIRGMFRIHT